jgi:hypothetical protein
MVFMDKFIIKKSIVDEFYSTIFLSMLVCHACIYMHACLNKSAFSENKVGNDLCFTGVLEQVEKQ